MSMHPILHIVKIGGHVLEEEAAWNTVAGAFAQLAGSKILVHGGGRKASELGEALGIPVRMYQGRRITDAETLEVVTMVYAGYYNKRLVAALQAKGCNALGLSGADANSIRAHKRRGGEVDFGYAGDIDAIDHRAIGRLIEGGFTPVFCALTHDQQGQLLNTNADTIAAALATALSSTFAVRLRYCFEKPGVLRDPERDDSLIDHMTRSDYARYRDEGIIQGGMLPKLDNAFRALAGGAQTVSIGSYRDLSTKSGTILAL